MRADKDVVAEVKNNKHVFLIIFYIKLWTKLSASIKEKKKILLIYLIRGYL